MWKTHLKPRDLEIRCVTFEMKVWPLSDYMAVESPDLGII
jgi:hypothetical protein